MKKPYGWIAALIVLVSIAIPIYLPCIIGTNTLYCGDKLSSGDLLSYIGALFASLITILGLSWTFADNRQGIREQGRLEVLPFIGMNVLNKEYRLSFFSTVMDVHTESQAISESNGDQYYREHRLDSVFFTIENDDTKATTKLTAEQQRLIKNNGSELAEIAKGVRSLVNRQLIFIPIEICNVGNGPAVDVRLALAIKKTNRKKFVVPVTLSVGEKIYVGVYCESDKIQRSREYQFEIYYKDIFGNMYKQATEINITKEDSKGILAVFDTETKQERVNAKELKRLYDADQRSDKEQ